MKKYTLLAILMCFSLVAKAQTSSGKHHIKYLDINSGNPDTGVAFIDEDEVVFTSTVSDRIINTEKHNPFLDFYKGRVDEEGSIVEKERLKALPTKKVSKNAAAFTKDGRTVYFSANKYAKKKSRKPVYQLFKATVDSLGIWHSVKKLPFVESKKSYSYPTINKDHTRLYFASDIAPSQGGTDIFYVDINEDGTYGKPVNIGEKVNTSGNETTPFIADNNFLYFSSDGHSDTMGGMDIYAVEAFENTISDPLHLASPINSINDDLAYIINNENKGFFSSNRLQGRGNDDIYSFYIEPDKPKECIQQIVGTVRDKDVESLVVDADINVVGDNGNILKTLKTDAKGNYNFTLGCNQTYTVVASKANYTKEEHVVNTANYHDAPPLEVNQFLTKEIKKVDDKLMVNINPIYFGFDKWNINNAAAVELDKIVKIMKENPALIIEAESHTDSRGPKAYNLILSERRAKATVKYIVSKGIDKSRITSKGYGESQPTNDCKDGRRCTIQQHRLNRRTDFVIKNKQALNIPKEEDSVPVEEVKEAVTTNDEKLQNTEETVIEETTETTEDSNVDTQENVDNNASVEETNDDVKSDEKQPENNSESQEEPKKDETVEKVESVEIEEVNAEEVKDQKEEETSNEVDTNEIKETTNKEEQRDEDVVIDDKTVATIIEKMSDEEEVTYENTLNTTEFKSENETQNVASRLVPDEKLKEKSDPERQIRSMEPEVKKKRPHRVVDSTSFKANQTIQVKSEKVAEVNVKQKIENQIKTEKPTTASDFSALDDTQAKKPVEEKNIVLENESFSYNRFNRDFTKKNDNVSAASAMLFDETDDFASYDANETSSSRLLSKVNSSKKTSQVSEVKKKQELKKQFIENTKNLKKEEVLQVNSIDVSPMSIKRNGKYSETSMANKTDVMRINFQINNNHYIQPGYKEVFILIQKPDGTILNKKGSFEMNNGSELTYTEKTNAYYNNNQLNLSMLTDRFIQRIVKGTYTVTIYIEGYPVGLEMFTLS